LMMARLYGQTVGIDYADQNAQMAALFMRNLIDAECGACGGRFRG
jgi:hypothetical protein